MAEGNDSGRLDRIEAALERMAAIQERDHDEFTRDHKHLMTWQVLMQEKMDRWAEDRDRNQKRLDALSEKTDQRIAELVSALGTLISSRPS
jgi:septal ring factor EnvC (AmiA/AmiB activator)